MDIQQALLNIKQDLENAIENMIVNGKRTDSKGVPYANGQKAKEALIRSQSLINYIHEFTKYELVRNGISASKIYPPISKSSPELKIAGLLKQKDQDVCVKPSNILAKREKITWGPLAYENIYCEYGKELTEQTLVINIRSQLSSLAKNADTLFERTFAEALNLHTLNPKLCLGEIYLIPVREYDDAAMKNNNVAFKKAQTNLEKYISFFNFISGRKDDETDFHMYERCTLLIVDFDRPIPKLYNTTKELIDDHLLPHDFAIELAEISINGFVNELMNIYLKRFKNNNILIK